MDTDNFGNFEKILDSIRRMKINECHRLKQSTLNFEVLIEIIKIAYKRLLLSEDKINQFLENLLRKQLSDITHDENNSNKIFVSVHQSKEIIQKHTTFLLNDMVGLSFMKIYIEKPYIYQKQQRTDDAIRHTKIQHLFYKRQKIWKHRNL